MAIANNALENCNLIEEVVELVNNERLVALTLAEFINEHFYGSQTAFAAAQGVQNPQVTQWLKKNFIVVDGVMFSERRKLKV